jgi:uncharacterized protein involved in high-affinity Fe2+ transport
MVSSIRARSLLKRTLWQGAILVCVAAGATSARASIALLMEEPPYGTFGAMNPTGHAAVYFNPICADTPTVLLTCHDGEYGVVISRETKGLCF